MISAFRLLLKSTLACALSLYSIQAAAQITITAPEQIEIGADLEIYVAGRVQANTLVALLHESAAEGQYDEHYVYLQSGKTEQAVKLKMPAIPGKFELRVLGPDRPFPTLARKGIHVVPITAELTPPAMVGAGKSFHVVWSGPANELDFIAIALPDSSDRQYLDYTSTKQGSPLLINAPEETGEYELRYYLGGDNKVIARSTLNVGSVSAELDIPRKALAGSTIRINWGGPDNPKDFITVVRIGAEERSYQQYVYTNSGNPASLRLPETPGVYEVRYLSGQIYSTLARSSIEVTAGDASVNAPVQAPAGSLVKVDWQGPDNDYDYIAITRKNDSRGSWVSYAHTDSGTPLQLRAPAEAGEYEIRYATGISHLTLASSNIRITPSDSEPGSVLVRVAHQNPDGVQVILDASGSMLQQLDGKRRIDIAKQTLTELTEQVLPQRTLFALRVFGREANSCQTDLVSPVAPLDASEISRTLESIQAKNNAKTPIADSLARIPDDLKYIGGERLVILLTDGEETCGGDPAATIRDITANDSKLRINIVGFAIDNPLLESSFTQWAHAGNGKYFSARNSEGLAHLLKTALKPSFVITDEFGNTIAKGIANDTAIKILPGEYLLQLQGHEEKTAITVLENEQTNVDL